MRAPRRDRRSQHRFRLPPAATGGLVAGLVGAGLAAFVLAGGAPSPADPAASLLAPAVAPAAGGRGPLALTRTEPTAAPTAAVPTPTPRLLRRPSPAATGDRSAGPGAPRSMPEPTATPRVLRLLAATATPTPRPPATPRPRLTPTPAPTVAAEILARSAPVVPVAVEPAAIEPAPDDLAAVWEPAPEPAVDAAWEPAAPVVQPAPAPPIDADSTNAGAAVLATVVAAQQAQQAEVIWTAPDVAPAAAPAWPAWDDVAPADAPFDFPEIVIPTPSWP